MHIIRRVAISVFSAVACFLLLQPCSVDCLKQSIATRLCLDPNSFVLYCKGKQIEKSQSFEPYKSLLTNNCTLVIGFSLQGGAERRPAIPIRTTNFSRQVDRRVPYDVRPSAEACMRCHQSGEAIKMPCGHAMCPACVVRYALSEVLPGSNQTEIVCLQPGCERVWTPGEIKKYGGAVDEEMTEITTKLSENLIIASDEMLQCPNCKFNCKRVDPCRLSARCENCAKQKKSNPWFCWRCRRPWTGSVNSDHCGNEDCRVSNVTISEELGHGAYGAVFLATKDGRQIVAKKVHDILEEARTVQRFKSEAMMMTKHKHPNIVQCLGIEKINGKFYLLMEFMRETLYKYIDRIKGSSRSSKFVVETSLQVANGLVFLHTQDPPIVHRDLTSSNILIAPDNSVKIGDFGMAKARHSELWYLNTKSPGNVVYMPPEALSESPQYTEKLDVFSLGVVMLEVETLEHPHLNIHGIGTLPEAERRHAYLSKVSDRNALKEIILCCLRNSYKDRPTAREVHSLLSRLT